MFLSSLGRFHSLLSGGIQELKVAEHSFQVPMPNSP